MSSKKQEKMVITKKFGFKRMLDSFKFSYSGLKCAYRSEQSMWIHAVSLVCISIIGIILKLSLNQWALVILSSLFIVSMELINTAIESTVDMVTKEYNEYAKVAKDCGSAASLVASVAHTAICLFVFLGALEKFLG